MNAPLVSIVTPTFNCGAKIAATASSVLSQEKGLAEYLVIDGGSTDDTLMYLRAQGSGLRWISEPDAGVYDAMNKGIRLAQGRFIYFLGAGDCLRPGVLQAVADRLSADCDSPQFIYGDVEWPASGGTYGGEFDATRLGWQNISHQAIFYDRCIFARLGGFDLRYKICADYAMNIRCFGDSTIRKTHLDLVVADFQGGGLSVQVDRAFYADLPLLAWRHLGLKGMWLACYFHTNYFRWAHWLHHRFRQFRGVLLRRRRGVSSNPS